MSADAVPVAWRPVLIITQVKVAFGRLNWCRGLETAILSRFVIGHECGGL